jgi:hypothetical protein
MLSKYRNANAMIHVIFPYTGPVLLAGTTSRIPIMNNKQVKTAVPIREVEPRPVRLMRNQEHITPTRPRTDTPMEREKDEDAERPASWKK